MDPIREIYEQKGTIAVVGASDNPARPSYEIAHYLKAEGFKMIPVNPHLKELLGEKCYPDLASIPGRVDVVDIFRKPDAVPKIVEQAIAKGAKYIWMQPGAENMDAAERVTQAGLTVIMGVCIMHNAFTKLGAKGVKA
jgi:uncharacterized protein